MWQLWTFRRPFENIQPAQLYHKIIIEGARPSLSSTTITQEEEQAGKTEEDMPIKYRQLMEQCWSREPDERPSMEIVLDRLREIAAEISSGGGQ